MRQKLPFVKNFPRSRFYKLRLMKRNQMFPHNKSLRELQTRFASAIHVRPLSAPWDLWVSEQEPLVSDRAWHLKGVFETECPQNFELNGCICSKLFYGQMQSNRCETFMFGCSRFVSTVRVCALKRNIMDLKGTVMDVNWCPPEFLDFHSNCVPNAAGVTSWSPHVLWLSGSLWT